MAVLGTLETVKPRWQFSIRSLLWFMVVVALLLAGFVQWRKLRSAERALARIAWATGDLSIPSGKFQLLVNKLVDTDDTKAYEIRFEANEPHQVRVDGEMSVTSPSEDGSMHLVQIKIVSMFDSMNHHLITMTSVGSAGGGATGHTIYPLKKEVKPPGLIDIEVQPGLYDLAEPVEIYREQGKPVMLTVK